MSLLFCTPVILDKNFYTAKSTTQLAKDLLGKIIVHNTRDGQISGMIVETEAYLHDDPACHAYIGKTPRTLPLFGEPGYSYVYIIYGIYHCFNVVANEEGIGEAVLIRALEPLGGLDMMKQKRKISDIYKLTSGPGRLCQAMNITKLQNLQNLYESEELYIEEGKTIGPKTIVTTTRIGLTVAKDLPLRFYIKDNKFISKR